MRSKIGAPTTDGMDCDYILEKRFENGNVFTHGVCCRLLIFRNLIIFNLFHFVHCDLHRVQPLSLWNGQMARGFADPFALWFSPRSVRETNLNLFLTHFLDPSSLSIINDCPFPPEFILCKAA